MQTMSLWGLLIALVVFIVMLYPYIRIVRRTGYSAWWLLTLFVPIVNLVMIWVFAFAKWPALNRANQ